MLPPLHCFTQVAFWACTKLLDERRPHPSIYVGVWQRTSGRENTYTGGSGIGAGIGCGHVGADKGEEKNLDETADIHVRQIPWDDLVMWISN